MKEEFYDVKTRAKVKAEVVSKKKTDAGRCQIFAKTADGRNLPKFVKADDYDTKYKAVPEIKAAAKKCCCKK